MLEKKVSAHRLKVIEYLRQQLIIKSPGFASLAMWIPTYPVDQNMVACTDGKLIYLGNKFFEPEVDQKEQMAVIIHELLHIVFCHIQRFKKLEFKNQRIFNEATDGIINYGIEQLSYVKLNKNTITLDYLLERDPIKYRISDSEWTSETLYEYLLKKKKDSQNSEQEKGKGNAEFPSENQHSDSLYGDLNPGSSSFAEEEGIEIPDYVKDLDNQPEEVQKEVWSKRLERARQGDSPEGILRKFENEFPKSKIDWRKPLRQYATQYLNNKKILNWNRTSRRMMSTASPIFTPGVKKSKAINRMGLVIDTSGSIDIEQLSQFLVEVHSIQKFASAELILIYADAAVAAKYTVKRSETSIIDLVKKGKITPKGGGGTNFIPALKELEDHNVDVAIYLTDMYGSFPQKAPKFPVIWAATSDIKGPFGKTIYIN